MRYYSEDTVDKIVQDVVFGKKNVFFSEYPSIDIPDEHGDLIDRDFLLKYAVRLLRKDGCDLISVDDIEVFPVVVPSTDSK